MGFATSFAQLSKRVTRSISRQFCIQVELVEPAPAPRRSTRLATRIAASLFTIDATSTKVPATATKSHAIRTHSARTHSAKPYNRKTKSPKIDIFRPTKVSVSSHPASPTPLACSSFATFDRSSSSSANLSHNDKMDVDDTPVENNSSIAEEPALPLALSNTDNVTEVVVQEPGADVAIPWQPYTGSLLLAHEAAEAKEDLRHANFIFDRDDKDNITEDRTYVWSPWGSMYIDAPPYIGFGSGTVDRLGPEIYVKVRAFMRQEGRKRAAGIATATGPDRLRDVTNILRQDESDLCKYTWDPLPLPRGVPAAFASVFGGSGAVGFGSSVKSFVGNDKGLLDKHRLIASDDVEIQVEESDGQEDFLPAVATFEVEVTEPEDEEE